MWRMLFESTSNLFCKSIMENNILSEKMLTHVEFTCIIYKINIKTVRVLNSEGRTEAWLP